MQSPTTRSNCHRVQRQIVDLAIGRSADSEAVHRELARPFWDRTALQLEQVFDRAAGPHERLRLDRLELNLGRLEGADWTIEFRRKLVAELTRTLAQRTAVSDPRVGNAASDSPPAEPWEKFLFFLVHGRLPWWGGRPSDGWTKTLFDDADAAGWSALRETILAGRGARARLVHSVDDEFLDAAIGRWSGLQHAARALEQLTPTHLRADAHRRWRSGFWMVVLDWVFAGGLGSPHRGPQLVRDLLALRDLCVSEGEHGRSFEPLPCNDSERGRAIGTVQEDELPEPWRGWLRTEGAAARFEPVALDTRTEAGGVSSRAPQLSLVKDAPHRHRRPIEDEAIYFGGAGAILLHPFLEQLFRERGLLAERSFRDTDARDRAVQLIGLLIFSSVDVPEYELLLAKLLCGAAFEEPLAPVLLEYDDVAACDRLLRAMLEHWTALRSSSPAWLREQFLLRDGKLEQVDSGYRLTVERRAQDVLLARLPWGFGVIGLPWLKARIFVHWMD
jgi:hypothetical protein